MAPVRGRARFSDSHNGLSEIEVNLLVGYRVAHKVTLWAVIRTTRFGLELRA
jgi:hypothetical protein